jgi:hypothetical protein
MIKFLTGGKHTTHLEKLGFPGIKVLIFVEWEGAIRDAAKKLWQLGELKKARKEVEDLEDKTNKYGKFTARINFRTESEIIQTLCTFFKSKNVVVGALKFDEVLVEKNPLITASLIEACQKLPVEWKSS